MSVGRGVRARRSAWAEGLWTAGVGFALASGVAASAALAHGRFGCGFALLLAGVIVLRWPLGVWSASGADDLSPLARRTGLLLVCACGLFFRFHRMVPPGLWGDDAINGLIALDVLDGKIGSPFSFVQHAHSQFHAITNYVIAAFFRLFGADLATLRLPGVATGALCVPLVYGTFAPLFGARTALVAAWLFASSPLQVNHSKVLLQVVFGQLGLLAGTCAFAQGVVRRSPVLAALAGLPLAFSLYTYHSAKLVPLIGLGFALAALSACTGRDFVRPVRTRLLLLGGMLLMLLLCAAPVIVSYLHAPSALIGRSGEVALLPQIRESGSLAPLWDAVWRTLMIFQYQQGPRYHWFGIGSDPALTALVAFLFVHGLVESVCRLREPRHGVLLWWALVGMVPGFLSTEAPRVYRVLLASPPFFLWAALPLVQIARAVRGRVAAPLLRSLVIAVLILVPLMDFDHYFVRTYSNREFRWFQADRMVEMARGLRRYGEGWDGVLFADSFGTAYESLRFLARVWHLHMRDAASIGEALPVLEPAGNGTVFMMTRNTLPALEPLRFAYPAVQADIVTEPAQSGGWFGFLYAPIEPLPEAQSLFLFPVSRPAADAVRGLTATYSDSTGKVLATRVDPAPLVVDPPAGAVRVLWQGSLHVPGHGEYTFSLPEGRDASLHIDGDRVLDAERPRHALTLAEGLHPLLIEAGLDGAAPGQALLLWHGPRAPRGPIAPSRFFRSPTVHGLLVEYASASTRLQRIEPYPCYLVVPGSFGKSFTVDWRGWIAVPPPGGHQLDIVSNGAAVLVVDGVTWSAGKPLPAGVHRIELRIRDAPLAAHLQLHWTRPDGVRELVPAASFWPPGPRPPA